MAQGAPRPGEKYLHFKNKPYQVLTVAKHSETGEELVIYQALYGDFGTYARPLPMFVSEVDRKKYPDALQRFRFQLMEGQFPPECWNMGQQPAVQGSVRNSAAPIRRRAEVTSTLNSGQGDSRGAAGTDKDITELLMEFYDAKTYEEKYTVLSEMKGGITDTMINNMAVVLDVVIQEGELDTRYEELRRCLRTYQKYETSRLH